MFGSGDKDCDEIPEELPVVLTEQSFAKKSVFGAAMLYAKISKIARLTMRDSAKNFTPKDENLSLELLVFRTMKSRGLIDKNHQDEDEATAASNMFDLSTVPSCVKRLELQSHTFEVENIKFEQPCKLEVLALNTKMLDVEGFQKLVRECRPRVVFIGNLCNPALKALPPGPYLYVVETGLNDYRHFRHSTLETILSRFEQKKS